jgi:hypothetical protein
MPTPCEIKIFLVDGVPNGIKTSELSNWSGKAVVVPRGSLSRLKEDEERKSDSTKAGIYILVGDDPGGEGTRVYVGEGENVSDRIFDHYRNEKMDFWDKVYFFVSKDLNLTKGHIKWLESHLIYLAHESKKSVVHNKTNPPSPKLPEADSASMKVFVDNICMMLPVLGCPFFEPIRKITIKPEGNVAEPVKKRGKGSPTIDNKLFDLNEGEEIFVMNTDSFQVCAIVTDDGRFIIPKGTKAKKTVPSTSAYQKRRKRLIAKDILIESDDKKFYLFSEDYEFNHPTPAVCVIKGGRENGHNVWKLMKDQNISYGDWKKIDD